MKAIFWTTITVLMFCSSTSNAATFLYFNSEPGDYIGQGLKQTWTPEDGTFTATGSNTSNVVNIHFNGTSWWYLDFAAPSGEILQPGPYENAARYPFQSPTKPGLSVDGDGRGCNELTGRFDVIEIAYTPEGKIDRFAADFEQRCDGAEAALFGSIRYNASTGFPLNIDITANGKHTPVLANVGETVTIAATIDAGDDEGINAEHWLGISGTNGTQWFNSKKWTPASKQPKRWFYGPVTTQNYTFDWTPKLPGVYMFQFVVDKQIDKKLDTQYVDHAVITVLSN